MDFKSAYGDLIDKIKPRIKQMEGFRARPYTCPKGYRTWLYGLNIDDPKKGGHLFTQNQIRFIIENIDNIEYVGEYMLNEYLHEAIFNVELLLQSEYYLSFYKLPDSVKIALVDMCYNMGIDDLMGFKKMLSAIRDKEWLVAYDECLDSKYGRDKHTRKRAKANAQLLLLNNEVI